MLNLCIKTEPVPSERMQRCLSGFCAIYPCICSIRFRLGFLCRDSHMSSPIVSESLVCKHCLFHLCNCCRIEWSDFWKKYLGTLHVVVDCTWTPNPKLYFDLLPFHKASENKSLKILKKQRNQPSFFFIFNICKGFTWNKMCSLFYLKAKK